MPTSKASLYVLLGQFIYFDIDYKNFASFISRTQAEGLHVYNVCWFGGVETNNGGIVGCSWMQPKVVLSLPDKPYSLPLNFFSTVRLRTRQYESTFYASDQPVSCASLETRVQWCATILY